MALQGQLQKLKALESSGGYAAGHGELMHGALNLLKQDHPMALPFLKQYFKEYPLTHANEMFGPQQFETDGSAWAAHLKRNLVHSPLVNYLLNSDRDVQSSPATLAAIEQAARSLIAQRYVK
jgi:hypothetical protein